MRENFQRAKITDLRPPLLKTTDHKELQFLQFYVN